MKLKKGVDKKMEMPEWIKRVQENIERSDVKQLYADEALVLGTVKGSKTKDGKIKKEGTLRMAFVDMTSMQPVAKIVVSVATAKGLINALSAQVQKIEKDLESGELPQKPKKEEPSLTYIG